MKHTRSRTHKIALLALASILAARAPNCGAQKMYAFWSLSESVDKAVSTDNLKAVASKMTDPEVLLGLACLAQTGSPARQEISEMAVKAEPEYERVVAVIAITMDGIDHTSVSNLIKCDPDNAVGHHLQGKLLYESGKEEEALAAFRKAGACRELRLYEPTTSAALFKALDALNLKGRDRLCALSWMASRCYNFSALGLQSLQSTLSQWARTGDIPARQEKSDLLLVLAGQLFVSNFENRWNARRALEAAFRQKAEIAAAEKSPVMNGYASVVQALASVGLSWPGINERNREDPIELARFLPDRIRRAFAMAEPSLRNATNLYELKVNLADSDKPAFEIAKENAINAAKALIEVALTDPDGILGPYLKGLPEGRRYEQGPWVSTVTPVEKLMLKRPDVFRAALTNQLAMDALSEAGKGDPRRRNIRRMMEIGLGLHSYAARHGEAYPDNIKVLFDTGLLKPPLEAKSLISAKPYIYVAAGDRRPVKDTDWDQLILLYDDQASEGNYQCVMANGSGQQLRVDLVQEQLRKRGK